MDDFNLDVNDKIEVLVGEKVYKALIVDIEDDGLRINLPVCNGEYLILNTGDKIEISSFCDENKCFSFSANVISRGKEGRVLYYRISEPFDVQKIQRRNFFRVGLVKEIECKVVTNIEEDDYGNIPYNKALMIDLSAGGLKLKTKENIKSDDLILVNLQLNKYRFELKADIVRIENTIDKEKIYGLRFADITYNQSEKIIQELFEVVRKQRANS